MPTPTSPFNQAVLAARAGARERARALFLECIRQDTDTLQAWVWLSDLFEAPAERLGALEKALALCPPESELRERIAARLATLRGSLPQEDTPPPARQPLENRHALNMVTGMLNTGKRAEAVQMLEKITAADPTNAEAWLLLSEADPEPAARLRALKQALALDPANQQVAHRIEQMRQLEKDSLQWGAALEARGALEEAAMVYLSINTHSRLPAERLEASQRIGRIRLRQEANSLHKVSPTLDLVRLALGPVVLFIVMIFMQSGLNPLHTPLLAIPGAISVLAGSLLVSATDLRPAHPKWIALFGLPGAGDEPEMRRGLRLLGLALLLAPYTMFFIEASLRLGVLQASMLSR